MRVYQANFEKSHIVIRFGAIFPFYGPTIKWMLHSVKYRDMGLKIGTRFHVHDMAIQVVLKKGQRF